MTKTNKAADTDPCLILAGTSLKGSSISAGSGGIS